MQPDSGMTTRANYRIVPASNYRTRSGANQNQNNPPNNLRTPPPRRGAPTRGGHPDLDSSLESISDSPLTTPNIPAQPGQPALSFTLVREKFGQDQVIALRRLKKVDLKGKKAILDKKFLQQCIELDMYPKWLNLKVGDLRSPPQQKLIKNFKLTTLKNEFNNKKNKTSKCFRLKAELSASLNQKLGPVLLEQWLTHIHSQNSILLSKDESRHHRKLTRLLLANHKIDDSTYGKLMRSKKPMEAGSDLNVIFNLSNHTLSEDEENGLRNGLKFIPTSPKIDEVELYARLESLVGTLYYIRKNPPELSDLAAALSRDAKNAVERFYSDKPIHNLPKKVNIALKALAKNAQLVISKPDKGNGVVLLNKEDYITKMKVVLDDGTKFRAKHNVDLYKSTLSLEVRIRLILNKMKNCHMITPINYEKAYPRGSRPCLLYGLPKVHKTGAPLRPIMSASGSAVHGLAQLLVPILAPLTTNEFSVSNSLMFAEELGLSKLGGLTLASFDISSLFTNIPLDETIQIILDANARKKLGKIYNPTVLKEALVASTKKCNFIFNEVVYEQLDGVAMGSPLGPTLANIFMCHFEETFLKNATVGKPRFYRRYVDDILLGFSEPADIDTFWQYYNSRHDNIKFTIEYEAQCTISFLDITIIREPETEGVITHMYRKNTFTGLLSKYNTFTYNKYKTGLIHCLLFRALKICSHLVGFNNEVVYLRDLFQKNRFPVDLFDRAVLEFKSKHSGTLNNKIGAVNPEEPPTVSPTVEAQASQMPSPPNEGEPIPDEPPSSPPPPLPPEIANPELKPNPLTVTLPFFGDASLHLRNGIRKKLAELFPDLESRIVFKSGRPLSSIFKFKDKVPTDLSANLIYKYTCSTCNVDYIGCTIRHLRTRISEHLGISATTGKKMGARNSQVNNHILATGHTGSEEDFQVLYTPPQNSLIKISETILIQRDSPTLNDTTGSYPLRVYPSNLGLEEHLKGAGPTPARRGINSSSLVATATTSNRSSNNRNNVAQPQSIPIPRIADPPQIITPPANTQNLRRSIRINQSQRLVNGTTPHRITNHVRNALPRGAAR